MVFLLVSKLIHCFNIFLPTCCLWVLEEIGPPFDGMSLGPVLQSFPLKRTLPTSHPSHCYLMRVFMRGTHCLQSPDGDSLVCMVTGKLGLRCTLCPSKLRHIWNPHLQGGTSLINLPIPCLLGAPVGGPKLLWQLPWPVFSTHRTCCNCVNKSLHFRGRPVYLETRNSTQAPW